jgi:GTP-binding protein
VDETGIEVNSGARSRLPMVAIIGRVNVGKSTLFNRLVRRRRALVEDRPGVTRDRLVAPARIEGRDVLLVDTGGLDPEAERGIEAAVRAQVRRAIEDASVILFTVDARAGLLPQDRRIADLLRRAERQVVVVANKSDDAGRDHAWAEFLALGFAEVIPVSAEHARGIADLEVTVAERLPPAEAAERGDAAVRVAILGRPNAGKSSLVNRLVGDAETVVAPEPGTTRDATDHRLRVGESEVVLTDTAGLRRRGRRDDRLERGSALMALRSIEGSDVAVLVVDAVAGVAEQDAKIARLALDRGRPLLVALNKWDAFDADERAVTLEREIERRLRFLPDARILKISARTGRGTSRVLPTALALHAEAKRRVPTSELNRALRDAVAALQPPMGGRKRPRLFYATQVSSRPFTVAVFCSNPEVVPENYRRYLESWFRKRFALGSTPVRVRLRSRREEPEDKIGRR